MIPSFYSQDFVFRADTMNFGEAVIGYVNMNINEIKESPDELINGLMFLDRRIGKRFIEKIDSNSLHSFARITYRLRCKLDNILKTPRVGLSLDLVRFLDRKNNESHS